MKDAIISLLLSIIVITLFALYEATKTNEVLNNKNVELVNEIDSITVLHENRVMRLITLSERKTQTIEFLNNEVAKYHGRTELSYMNQ